MHCCVYYNDADLSMCAVAFIEIGQEIPELANRFDLTAFPICI